MSFVSPKADLTQFFAATKQLAKLSGKDHAEVIRAETGKILETAVRYTPKADREKIVSQTELKSVFDFENKSSDAGKLYTNKKKDDKVWFSPGSERDKWFLIMDWKVPDAVWGSYLRVLSQDVDDLQTTINRRTAEALARRGLAAKTWIQVGDAIGATVKAPGYVQNAEIPPAIGRGTVTTGENDAVIEGLNSSISLIATKKGQGIIDRAIRSRVKFLETAIRKGALETLEKRAKSFPHLFRN